MELKLLRVEIIAWSMKKGDSSSHRESLMFRLSATSAVRGHIDSLRPDARRAKGVSPSKRELFRKRLANTRIGPWPR